jgi:hypothetical protein
MRKSKIFFCFLVTFCICAQEIDPSYDYGSFSTQFGRNYTGDERTQH